MSDLILVTGATGTVGRHLAGALAAAGRPLRVLGRDAARAAAICPAAAEAVQGDLTDPATLGAALDGVTRAFVVLAADAGAGFAAAAADSPALEHVVLISADAPARPDEANPLFRKHVLGEAALSRLRVPVTVLRSAPFASLALQWSAGIRAAGTVGALRPDLPLPVIDPRDIADAAAACLLGAPQAGTHLLTGPELLDTYARARILGEETGRELSVRKLTEDEWLRAVSAVMPEAYARAFAEVERYLDEARPRVTDGVRRLTGRDPRDFRSWVRDHAGAFRP